MTKKEEDANFLFLFTKEELKTPHIKTLWNWKKLTLSAAVVAISSSLSTSLWCRAFSGFTLWIWSTWFELCGFTARPCRLVHSRQSCNSRPSCPSGSPVGSLLYTERLEPGFSRPVLTRLENHCLAFHCILFWMHEPRNHPAHTHTHIENINWFCCFLLCILFYLLLPSKWAEFLC